MTIASQGQRFGQELLEDGAQDGVVYTEPIVSAHLHAGSPLVGPTTSNAPVRAEALTARIADGLTFRDPL